MMKLLKAFAILFGATLIAEACFIVPPRDLVAVLIFVMVITMRFRCREDDGFRAIFYVSAVAAISFLYFGQPTTLSNAVADRPNVVENPEPSISTTFDPRDGSMTVHYSGDYLRPKREANRRLLQESPEVWREQLHKRIEMYKRIQNMDN